MVAQTKPKATSSGTASEPTTTENDSKKPKSRFRISSKHLILASAYVEKMLSGHRHSSVTGCQQVSSVMPAYSSDLGSMVPACLSQAGQHECESQMYYRQSCWIAQ